MPGGSSIPQAGVSLRDTAQIVSLIALSPFGFPSNLKKKRKKSPFLPLRDCVESAFPKTPQGVSVSREPLASCVPATLALQFFRQTSVHVAGRSGHGPSLPRTASYGCSLAAFWSLFKPYQRASPWLPHPITASTATAVEMALCLHTCQHLTYILPESRTFYCSLSSPPAVAPGTRNVPYNHLEKAVEERAECSWRWFVIAFLDCQESVLPMVKLLSNLLKFCGIFNILPVIFFF